MVKKLFFITLLYYCTCLNVIQAQDHVDANQLFCRVLEEGSKQPILYATVKFIGTNRGLISDDRGEFRLPLDLNTIEKIEISSIGFGTKEISVKELRKDQINIIYLKSKVEELDAVALVLKKKKLPQPSAEEIVAKALRRIPMNYPKTPFSYIGYYRDYQQPADDSYSKLYKGKGSVQYVNLNEGIIEVFDAGFGTDYFGDNKNQTLLYSYGRNATFIQDSTLSVPYDNDKKKYLKDVTISPLGGNELSVLNITDILRNHDKVTFSFVDMFDKDFMKNHFFTLEGLSYLGDIPIYKIGFLTEAKIAGTLHYGKGKIYISKENYAIHKFNYEMYEKDKEIKKSPLYAATLEYKDINGKMYLNYLTFNNKFQANSDHYFKVKKTVFDEEDLFFDVYFNRKFDKKTISSKKNRFKIEYTYKQEKINVKEVLIFDDYVRVLIDKNQLLSSPDFNKSTLKRDLRLTIKNIKDIDGNLLDKIPSVKVNQYREIFVQEVFPGKKVDKRLKVMNKYAPLLESEINQLEEKEKYWVNTPLKRNRNN
ncbi:carboxypeptidase-like regulatory domain-containing protein [Aquimarina aggregata]|uniref:carboxypeptidase-like regulatory domain-containing protein n=1 Tax=Aquimarina aggregata TaxID=1642818 RepID=UPI002493B6AF|nr:carboxypeptidase-like regulatory domain-containing protein [Aquimarina aggregata]